MPFRRRILTSESTRREFEVKRDGAVRLDLFLADRLPTLSRALIQRFVKEGRALINGRPSRASSRVRRGDRVVIKVPHVVTPEMVPTEIPLEVLYEDDDLIAVNKPPGMVAHPASGHWEDTLVNAVLAHVKIPIEAKDIVRPGIVHRLDKDTSGVMVLGKSNRGLAGLAKQFRDRAIEKEYRAVVHGRLEPARGAIELPIDRDRTDRKRMGIARAGTGKAAVSRYEVLESFGGRCSHVSVRPETGRMHQIRVHLYTRGHPCVGDPLYEGERRLSLRELDPALPDEPAMRRQALHARALRFSHPADGRPMALTAPLPADMERLLEMLRKASTQT